MFEKLTLIRSRSWGMDWTLQKREGTSTTVSTVSKDYPNILRGQGWYLSKPRIEKGQEIITCFRDK